MSKHRFGFVSNSSSNSFICNVCGGVKSGMDASPSDFDMSFCINDHTFCDSHANKLQRPPPAELQEILITQIRSFDYWKSEKIEQKIKEINEAPDEDLRDYIDEFFDDGLPEFFCPICSLAEFQDKDILKYLVKKSGLSLKKIKSEIPKEFKTYKEFEAYIK